MKIAPNYNIAIRGVHAPAGVAVEVDDRTGMDLIAQGIAVRVTETETRRVEAAAVAPSAETAAATPTAGKKRRA